MEHFMENRSSGLYSQACSTRTVKSNLKQYLGLIA
jgi:hypothetical protein